MFIALLKRYEAEIEDAVYRIDAINEHNLIIPEHTDILGEVDKMLQKISNAEDRLAALRRHYGQKKGRLVYIRDLKSLKNFYKKSNEKKVYFCTFDLEVLILLTLGWTLYGTNYV